MPPNPAPTGPPPPSPTGDPAPTNPPTGGPNPPTPTNPPAPTGEPAPTPTSAPPAPAPPTPTGPPPAPPAPTGDPAAEATAAVLRQVAAALNLGQDQTEPPTVEQLTAQLETATAAQTEGARELAVWRAAADAGADPAALLDSRAAMNALAQVDHTDAKAVAAAIKAAVTANPSLAARHVNGASGPDLTGGTRETQTTRPASLQDAVRQALAG